MSRKKEKIKAVRASVPELRDALNLAQELVRGGVGFVCVPYFTREQKVAAGCLAAQHLDSVDIEVESNETRKV